MRNEELSNLDGVIYKYDEIPIHRDIFIINDAQFDEFVKLWEEYFLEGNAECIHPNNHISYKVGYIQKSNSNSLEVNIGVNTSSRFHGVSRILPKARITGCIEFTSIGDNPYLIVDESWFKEIYKSIFSTYALIDAVGMRKLLECEGEIEERKILEFNKELNKISRVNKDLFFFAYADSVLIKANWSANKNDYENTFNPECFLLVVKKVSDIFKLVFDLDAYSILTQGVNQIKLSSHVELSKENNFVFFNSLGAHFAELFNIEEFVRGNIRNNKHSAKNIYLSKSLFLTMNLKNKEKLEENIVEYKSNQQVTFEHEYIHLNWTDLVD